MELTCTDKTMAGMVQHRAHGLPQMTHKTVMSIDRMKKLSLGRTYSGPVVGVGPGWTVTTLGFCLEVRMKHKLAKPCKKFYTLEKKYYYFTTCLKLNINYHNEN